MGVEWSLPPVKACGSVAQANKEGLEPLTPKPNSTNTRRENGKEGVKERRPGESRIII